MPCYDPSCYNFNKNIQMYCEKCVILEMRKMTDEELLGMYYEGVDFIKGIRPSGVLGEKLKSDFDNGWFNLLNTELLRRENDTE